MKEKSQQNTEEQEWEAQRTNKRGPMFLCNKSLENLINAKKVK